MDGWMDRHPLRKAGCKPGWIGKIGQGGAHVWQHGPQYGDLFGGGSRGGGEVKERGTYKSPLRRR